MSDAGEVIDLTVEEMFEANWVRVSELIGPDGTPVLVVTDSGTLTPWAVSGLLLAAADFQRTLVTNIFYGQTYEDMVSTECMDGTCDCEDEDPNDEIWGTP